MEVNCVPTTLVMQDCMCVCVCVCVEVQTTDLKERLSLNISMQTSLSPPACHPPTPSLSDCSVVAVRLCMRRMCVHTNSWSAVPASLLPTPNTEPLPTLLFF